MEAPPGCHPAHLDLRGLGYVFWGVLIVVVDIRIKGFDLLPDALGAILIIVGLSSLRAYSRFFRYARNLSIPILLLSVPELFGVHFVLNFNGAVTGFGRLFLTGSLAVLSFAFCLGWLYCLCRGVAALARAAGRDDLRGRGRSVWRRGRDLAIAGIGLAAIAYLWAASAAGRSMPILLIVGLVLYALAGLVYLILFLAFLRSARKEMDQAAVFMPGDPGRL